MKHGELASDAISVVYLYIFIGSYMCAAGSIAVTASYFFVAKLYNSHDLRME